MSVPKSVPHKSFWTKTIELDINILCMMLLLEIHRNQSTLYQLEMVDMSIVHDCNTVANFNFKIFAYLFLLCQAICTQFELNVNLSALLVERLMKITSNKVQEIISVSPHGDKNLQNWNEEITKNSVGFQGSIIYPSMLYIYILKPNACKTEKKEYLSPVTYFS